MAQRQIGAFEAKTHFSRIIGEVEQGADFIITRRGKPVGKIIPFQQVQERNWEDILERFSEIRKHYNGKPGDFNIREAIEEGRR